MKLKTILTIALFTSVINASAHTVAANTLLVKKSKNKRCHTQESPYYHQIKHYIAYKNLEACLESGGQLAGKQGERGVKTQV